MPVPPSRIDACHSPRPAMLANAGATAWAFPLACVSYGVARIVVARRYR